MCEVREPTRNYSSGKLWQPWTEGVSRALRAAVEEANACWSVEGYRFQHW